MDYEKKYKEALERAKNINNEHRAQPFDVMTRVFPELKESKDEKIRKEIISALKFANVKGVYDKHIAWLEKQCEKKSINDTDEDIVEAVKDTSILDIVEPKFKVGDWIVKNDGKDCFSDGSYVLQIIDIDCNRYKISNECYLTEPFANTYRLWTITDAKDGDVLSDGTTIFIFKDLLSDGSVMSYCDYETGNCESDAFCPLSMNLMCLKINPATKEQRDLLLQKMHDEGYEWNDEKRELKKIEQKYAWSEDDENMLKSIIATCKLAEQDRDSSPARHLFEMQDNWLKSLKERIKGE